MITKQKVLDYILIHKIVKRNELAKYFNTYPNFISKLLKDEIILYDLNSKENKHFTLFSIIKSELNSLGLCSINNRVFSKHGKVKPTIIHLIDSSKNGLKTKELDTILKTGTKVYLRQLTKNGQIIRGRIGKSDIYFSTDNKIRKNQLKNNRNEIILDTNPNNSIIEGIDKLDNSDYVLRDLEMIRQVKSGVMKKDVASKFNVSPETVANKYKRFETSKTKGLIHERKCKSYKIDSSTEAAIIIEAKKYPNKSDSELANSIKKNLDLSVKTIRKVIDKFKPALESQKKLLLEIR